MIGTYLRNRAREWETWIGLGLVAGAVAWCLWHWRIEIHRLGEALIGAVLAALPRRWPEIVRCALTRFFTRTAVPASQPQPLALPVEKESPSMSIFETLKAEAEAELGPILMNKIEGAVSAYAPQAQQVFVDFQALQAHPGIFVAAQFIADTAELVHSLASQVEALKAQVAASPASPVEAAPVAEPVA